MSNDDIAADRFGAAPATYQLKPRLRAEDYNVPIGSVRRSIGSIEDALEGAPSFDASSKLSVLVAEIEDNQIRSAALLEDLGGGKIKVLPLSEKDLRSVLFMPDFDASMNIDDRKLSVNPDQDVKYVLDSMTGVDLSDLPETNAPRGWGMARREDMSAEIDQEMVVIGKSADGTRVIGLNGGEYLSVTRDAFSEDPKFHAKVLLTRDLDGRERATIDSANEIELGR